MAIRLPTRDDLGELPSAKTGSVIASYDTTAIGQGMSDFGRGVSTFGNALAEMGRRQEQFKAESAFQDFQYKEQLAFDETMRSAGPDGIEQFSENWQRGYMERAKQFKKDAIPQAFKNEYDLKLFATERQLYGNALTFQYEEQKRAATNGMFDATANIYAPKARSATTDQLGAIVKDFDALLETNRNLTGAERDEIRRKAMREIGLAHVQAMAPDQIERMLSNPMENAPEPLEMLTTADRQSLLNAAIREQEAVENDRSADLKSGVTKEGYDLLFDDKMTADWIGANRDILSASDYKTFLRALEPDSRNRKTEPEEYLRLYDLAENDPEAAMAELRAMYGQDALAKDDFKTLYARANQSQERTRGRAYTSEIRGYIKTQLRPDTLAPKSHYARQLDAMFQFDDWLEKNPNKGREEIRREADAIVKDFRKIRYAKDVTEFPVPMHVTKPRDQVTEADILAAKTRIAQDLQSGTIQPAQAAEQAALLRRWLSIVGGDE